MTRHTHRTSAFGSRLGAFAFAFTILGSAVVGHGSPALADYNGATGFGQPTPGTTATPFAPAASSSGQGPENVQQAAASRLPLGMNYRIHAGDQLSVQVYGDQSLSQSTTVLPDGSINYPLIGRVVVRGLSTEDAGRLLASRMQSYVRHPYVTVSIAAPAQFTILVLGNVRTPGKYFLRSDARVTDALAAAGGLAPTNGSLPVARISLGAANVQQVNLQKLFHDGDTAQNMTLEDGSVVYVPSPNTFEVEVVGSVDHPGNITLNEGDRLSMAIAKAGNSQNSNADLNHVHITRANPNGGSNNIEVNLYQTLLKGDLSADVPLYKGDVVYVPISKNGAKAGSGIGGTLFLFRRLLGVPF